MTWVLTISGRKVDLLDPQPASICIEDIAHALSLQCRFNGHCSAFYSVAQHCVECSWIASPKFALECLLHDAPEAYTGDIVRPLKELLAHEGNLERIEADLEAAIATALGARITPGYYREVKRVDLIMLATEKRDLMPLSPEPWPVLRGVTPLDDMIEPWPSDVAHAKFLARYRELTADDA